MQSSPRGGLISTFLLLCRNATRWLRVCQRRDYVAIVGYEFRSRGDRLFWR